jgi:hypothetical protein
VRFAKFYVPETFGFNQVDLKIGKTKEVWSHSYNFYYNWIRNQSTRITAQVRFISISHRKLLHRLGEDFITVGR